MRILFPLSLIVAFLTVQPTPTEEVAFERIRKFPGIDGQRFRCSEIIEVVNHLRKLGKEKALAALRKYDKKARENKRGEDPKIQIICRLLFANPDGWTVPRIGAPYPEIKHIDKKNFPLFPIALSDGTPFLLIVGYNSRGSGEETTTCLKLCEGLSLVKDDYPLEGYEKAANTLINMESFRQLYDNADRRTMAEMILLQAKISNVTEK